MAGGNISKLATGLLLGLFGLSALAARVTDPASARRDVTSPAIVAIDSQLAGLAAEGRTGELAARLDVIARDRTLDLVAQEWLLDRGLHRLASLPPAPAAQAIVTGFTARAPIVYARVDPDLGDRAVPYYDTGATARFVLRSWRRAAARNQAAADLQSGRDAVVARFAALPAAGDSEPERSGIIDAFNAAKLASLAAQRAAIVAALTAGERIDEPAMITARRTSDAELMGLVLGQVDAPVALAATGAIRQAFDGQTALELLSGASRRADIASAAMLEIGRLARNDGEARDFLFDALDDPDLGPSAAAALAAIGDAGVTAELGRRLRTGRSETALRMLVLALKLDSGHAAREELRRFAATGKGSPQLQQEVRHWLER